MKRIMHDSKGVIHLDDGGYAYAVCKARAPHTLLPTSEWGVKCMDKFCPRCFRGVEDPQALAISIIRGGGDSKK